VEWPEDDKKGPGCEIRQQASPGSADRNAGCRKERNKRGGLDAEYGEIA